MRNFVIAIFALIAIISCTKEDRKNQLVTQEEAIDKYISSLKDVRIARNGGSNRLVYKEGKSGADSLALGDSVKFFYAGYVFSNGKGSLFATNDTTVAQRNGFELSGGIEEKVLSSKEMKEKFSFTDGDSEGFVNLPLNIRSVKVSGFFTEGDEFVRVSLRSKDDFSVNRLARGYFNGGGHERAAGGRLFIPINEVPDYFVKSLGEFIEKEK